MRRAEARGAFKVRSAPTPYTCTNKGIGKPITTYVQDTNESVGKLKKIKHRYFQDLLKDLHTYIVTHTL